MRFFRVLVHTVPGGLAVFVKVRLMDVLFVDDGAWKESGAPASGMHVDFVLADVGTLGPDRKGCSAHRLEWLMPDSATARAYPCAAGARKEAGGTGGKDDQVFVAPKQGPRDGPDAPLGREDLRHPVAGRSLARLVGGGHEIPRRNLDGDAARINHRIAGEPGEGVHPTRK